MNLSLNTNAILCPTSGIYKAEANIPHYSAFTRYGHLRFSSKPSHGERFYRAIYNALGGNYSTDIGSRAEAAIYARAMRLARAKGTLQKAGNQNDPRRVTEMLPAKEAEYGIVPGLRDNVFDREAALMLKRKLPLGARYTAVTAALSGAIGTDFLYYRVTKRSEITTFPASPGAGPGNWVGTSKPIATVRLISPVSITGTPTQAFYEAVDPDGVSQIVAGVNVVVSTNNIGIAERVFATAADPSSFTATFANAHDSGDVCTTAQFPYWTSNQGHVLVIVKPAAARDPEKRRRVNQVMKQIMRTWVTWSILPSTNGTSTDVFTIDDPVLGLTDNAGIEGVTFP